MLVRRIKAFSGRFLRTAFVIESNPGVLRFGSCLMSLRISPGDVKYLFWMVAGQISWMLVFTSGRPDS